MVSATGQCVFILFAGFWTTPVRGGTCADDMKILLEAGSLFYSEVLGHIYIFVF